MIEPLHINKVGFRNFENGVQATSRYDDTSAVEDLINKINEIIKVVNELPTCDCDSCVDFRNDD